MPPLPLSNRSDKDGRCTHSSWQSVSLQPEARLEQWALRIIEQSPALPKIEKGNIAAAGVDGSGGGPSIGGARIGAAGPGGAGGGGGGVFGAKQAMLERERAKEAQRPLSMRDAASCFPTLLPSPDGLDEADDDSDPKVVASLKGRTGRTSGTPSREQGMEGTLSCVSNDKGVCELFLSGCVHLGAVDVGGRVLAVTGIPPQRADGAAWTACSVRLVAHYMDSSDSLAIRTISVPVPATLRTVVRHSTALRAVLEHAFEALQEARNLWDEARRIGKGWLQRLGDVSRPHGGASRAPKRNVLLRPPDPKTLLHAVKHSPATQLHLLLVTGRPTRSLHDFLASKLNERGLVKWEQAMAAALERLREVGWLSIVPALERSVLLLREMDAWARWCGSRDPLAFLTRAAMLTLLPVAGRRGSATMASIVSVSSKLRQQQKRGFGLQPISSTRPRRKSDALSILARGCITVRRAFRRWRALFTVAYQATLNTYRTRESCGSGRFRDTPCGQFPADAGLALYPALPAADGCLSIPILVFRARFRASRLERRSRRRQHVAFGNARFATSAGSLDRFFRRRQW